MNWSRKIFRGIANSLLEKYFFKYILSISFFYVNSANEDLAQDLFGTTLDKVITGDHQNAKDDEEEIDSLIQANKYFGGSLDELIAWEDKLTTCDDR